MDLKLVTLVAGPVPEWARKPSATETVQRRIDEAAQGADAPRKSRKTRGAVRRRNPSRDGEKGPDG